MTTIILTTDEVKARLFTLLANQITPRFISVKNYTNEAGEVSNYVVNIGTDYGTAKDSDTITLLDAKNLEALDFGKVAAFSEEARVALLEANLKITPESEKLSAAQTNAYTEICENVRMHNETGRLYIWGMRISKEIILPGVYKEVKSRPLTIAKNIIRKTLKTTNFRQFCIDKIVEVRINGETLEFSL